MLNLELNGMQTFVGMQKDSYMCKFKKKGYHFAKFHGLHLKFFLTQKEIFANQKTDYYSSHKSSIP